MIIAKWTRVAKFMTTIGFSAVAVALTALVSFAATAEEFYMNALQHEGINAFAATCQSAHETGFWTSALWKNANNGAGIKADKNWRKAGNPSVKRKSVEEVKGKRIYRESYFRAYDSLPDFLKDYRVKINRDYPLAARNADTMWGYFAALQKGRLGSWATTQRYFEFMADKAVRLAPRLLGMEWRAQLLREYREATARGLLSPKEIAIVEKKLLAVGISPR